MRASDSVDTGLLTASRPHPFDEADLRFFFLEAEGSMGLKSSFESFVHQCQVGPGRSSGRGGDPYTDAVVAAAARWRVINGTLNRCSRRSRRVLQRYVLEVPRRPELVQVYGRLAGVVLFLDGAKAHRVAVAFLLAPKASARRPLADEISAARARAEAAMLAAVRDYAASKPKPKARG